MTARRIAFALVVALAAYFVLIGWRGVTLIADGRPVPVILGLAVLIFPFLGGYLVWREVQFGFGVQSMGRQLEAEGGLPVDDLPRLPSGRAERDAADERFLVRKAEAEADPDNWRVWFRLSLAYDDARDRKRARSAMRHALALRAGAPTPP